ncbi:hypothetical protein DUI87_05225 [Hirundo rustica rustica]|uniref:Uncharacterized protein n=1 Tax=Hirundo rustica rustica TaxID=333673 RepID=A0A3M0KW67_HIRRU|nr:hypothetical protein DUI87_05225 [Hirundo rustica rustica]
MESQCYPGGCQVVPIWKLVTMWPSEKEEEETVILISDDDDGEVQCPDDGGDEVQCPDDDDDDDESTQGSSVVFVEPQEKSPLEEPRSEEMVDEEGDLVVTYCKQANVMPHARHDCTTHPFERTESDICSPLGKNADICDQCYCYICDKLAAECQLWTVPSLCHCNAHNKSNFWKAQRSFALAGVLATFNLELLELDAELRHGGDLLEKFIKDLSVAYNKYLGGERMCPPGHECCCEPKLPPGQCDVCSSQKMEVVYKYSDVFELVTRFLNQAEQESPKAAAIMLLGAAKQIALHKDPAMITVRLQRMLVLCDFPKILNQKFIEFFQSISLPCHCYAFSNRYKEVVRYLRAVKCNENQRLRDLRDLIPFYLCKTGHFLDAAHSLLFPVNSLACCSACRITPCQFSVYLKIFRTGCVPSGNDVLETGSWAKCWSSFIMILASSCSLEKRGNLVPLSLEEPPLDFQENVLTATGNFLEDLKSGVNVSLPSSIFSGQLHQEASLILAVQAVQQMLCYDLPHLASFLEIILAFGKNFWALRLLLDQLSCAEHILCGTANLLLRDLSQEKATVLTVWQNLGPQYVGEFLCLFLTCRHKRMQSVGLFSLRLVIDNLHLCPWVKQLCTFFQESGLRRLPFGTTVYHEVSKFVSAFEKL